MSAGIAAAAQNATPAVPPAARCCGCACSAELSGGVARQWAGAAPVSLLRRVELCEPAADDLDRSRWQAGVVLLHSVRLRLRGQEGFRGAGRLHPAGQRQRGLLQPARGVDRYAGQEDRVAHRRARGRGAALDPGHRAGPCAGDGERRPHPDAADQYQDQCRGEGSGREAGRSDAAAPAVEARAHDRGRDISDCPHGRQSRYRIRQRGRRWCGTM